MNLRLYINLNLNFIFNDFKNESHIHFNLDKQREMNFLREKEILMLTFFISNYTLFTFKYRKKKKKKKVSIDGDHQKLNQNRN